MNSTPLVDRRRGQQRRDDDVMQRRAQRRHQQDRERRRGPVRHAEYLDHVVHAVHADHDKLGVADPGDVDDAEDQIEPEREQRQHAAEQDAIDHGFQQIDVEDVQKRLHLCPARLFLRHDLFGKPVPTFPDHAYTPKYACLIVSVDIISSDVPDARMVPASSR
jgi:hypothetical protein